jgi:hypothetical protein
MKNAPAGGPGQGGGSNSNNPPPDTAPDQERQRSVDPRAAWLLRAASRYDLLRAGAMTLDQAFDLHFVSDLLDAIPDICPCHTSICDHFDAACYEFRFERLQRWRRSPR